LLNIIALTILLGLAYSQSWWWFLAFFVFPLGYFVWEFIEWRRREYILTDRRVVRQEGVFSSSSFDAALDKINNVYHRQSFMGKLLKYGEVGLETASEQGMTVFDFLLNPFVFKNAIISQRELYTSHAEPAAAAPALSIPQLINELASLRDREIITESEFQEKKRALLEKM
jgi:uncharacterized membrane protein YdbT with pleckstrin-like domain